MTLDLTAHTWLGNPLAAQGLSLVPLFGRRPPVPMAVAPGHPVEVLEQEAPTVSALQARNPGDPALLVPAGVLLTGGWQDRVVVRPAVLAAGARGHLHTRCVEPQRWQAGAAGRGFSLHREPVDMQARRQHLGDGQAAVWAGVAAHRADHGRPRAGSLAEGRDLPDLTRRARALALPASACGVVVFWDHPGAPALPLVEACGSAAAFQASWPHLAATLLEAHDRRLAARGLRPSAALSPRVDLHRALRALRKLTAAPPVARHPTGAGAVASRLLRRGAVTTTGGWAVTRGQRLWHLRLDRHRHAG